MAGTNPAVVAVFARALTTFSQRQQLHATSTSLSCSTPRWATAAIVVSPFKLFAAVTAAQAQGRLSACSRAKARTRPGAKAIITRAAR